MKTTINAALVFTMHLLATAWAGAAQQGGQVHQIGMLISGFVATHGQRMEFFRQGLRQLGYVKGKNVSFVYRYAEGRTADSPTSQLKWLV